MRLRGLLADSSSIRRVRSVVEEDLSGDRGRERQDCIVHIIMYLGDLNPE